MWDTLVSFFNWYWKSGLGVLVLLIPAIPVISWEVIKRLPNSSRSRSRSRRGGRRVK